MDGLPIGSEAERQRVILCIEAAIERRVSEVNFILPFHINNVACSKVDCLCFRGLNWN